MNNDVALAMDDTPNSPWMPDEKARQHAQLTVTDSGCGMDRATLERVFDPYFTTKAPSEGTGLGLAIVRGIVKGHGGSIALRSLPRQGTTVTVRLPIMPRAKTKPTVDVPTPTPTSLTGSERILLVDDEVAIVQSEKQTLETLGYRVMGCNDGQEALGLFRACPTAFDVVVTDQTMPRLTGIELAKELLQIRPDIPVILLTGYRDLADAGIAREAGIRQFVMKPVNGDELAYVVRRACEQGRHP